MGEGELLHRRQQAPQFPLPVAYRQSPANLDGLQIQALRIPNDEVTLPAVLVVTKRLPPAVQFNGHNVFQYPALVFREILRQGNKALIHEIDLFGVHNPLPGGIGKLVGAEDEKGFLEIGEVIRQGALAARLALAFQAFFEGRQGEPCSARRCPVIKQTKLNRRFILFLQGGNTSESAVTWSE